MRRCWRLNPDPTLDYQVEQLARRESRSTSNMLTVLVKEALAARRQIQAHASDVSRLAAVIAGKPDDAGTAA